MEKLTAYIQHYVDINEEDLATILANFECRNVKKNAFVLKKEQVVTDYYFIASGGLIIYDVKQEIQSTRYFAFENEFITDISKIKRKARSDSYLRAIEDTVIYAISFQKMEALYDQFPTWQKFGRLVWEDAFASVLYGIHNFQSLSAKERYLDLVKRSNLINRVPLKDLSLFLGITPQSLSRIRKEISTSKS